MRLMIVTEEIDQEYQEILNTLEPSKLVIYDPNLIDWKCFEEDQVHFDAIYSLKPEYLLGKKLRIPYFYNIPKGYFSNELNFNCFNRYYSQLSGPSAVFVNDKKLNKYCAWAGLNSYWINKGISLSPQRFQKKKFLTPNLNIGFLGKENIDIIKDAWYAKKSNWVLHTEEHLKPLLSSITDNIHYYDSNQLDNFYKNIHILIKPLKSSDNRADTFLDGESLRAMLSGSILVSSNPQGNNTHILFDKVNYFKLDFVEKNTILETLRYLDKRREKLERVGISGRKTVKKYFNLKNIALQKLNIIQREIA